MGTRDALVGGIGMGARAAGVVNMTRAWTPLTAPSRLRP